MNYVAHYDRLIERARGRELEGYKERHHVLPRCMGGDNSPENLVDLTGEEHYVAHQLLVKMHPYNGRLAHAAMAMAKQCTGNKSFGWLRRRKALSMIGNTQTLGKKLGPQTPDHIEMRIAPTRGKPRSQDIRAKISAALIGKKLSPEHKKKISEGGRGTKRPPRSQQHIEKLRAVHLGSHHTKEHRLKQSLSLLGNKYAAGNKNRLGVPHSPEARAKISAAVRRSLASKLVSNVVGEASCQD